MKILEVTILTYEQKERIFKLWNQEYSQKLNHKQISDLEKYLEGVTDHVHYLLLDDVGKITGWGFKFFREEERWFSILVERTEHRKGNGTLLLNKLKENEECLNGWVVDHELDTTANGERYISPVKFYLKNGFVIMPEIRFETDQLSAVKMIWKREGRVVNHVKKFQISPPLMPG